MNAASPTVKLVVFDLDGTLLRGDWPSLFVGKRAPDMQDLVHLPEADILTVARTLVSDR